MTGFGGYDYLVYIVPGAMLLVTMLVLLPKTRRFFGPERMDVGGFGLFVFISFALGLMVNMLSSITVEPFEIAREQAYQSYTLLTKDLDLVAPKVRERFLNELNNHFPELREQLDRCNTRANSDPKSDVWKKGECQHVRPNIVRRVHNKVVTDHATDRMDIYAQHFALSLAATVALVLIFLMLVLMLGFQWCARRNERMRYWMNTGVVARIPWPLLVTALIVVGASACFCLDRVNAFDRNFARELFNAFAFISDAKPPPPNS